MIPIAFCEREADLAPMTILRAVDGRLVARRRLRDDRIVPTHRSGRHEDLWVHERAGGRYVRHDDVFDMDAGLESYDYSAMSDGRLWLRPVREWREPSGGSPRFRPLCDRAVASVGDEG